MAFADPVTPDPRRLSIRLPRPLWIGLATIVVIVVGVGLRIGLPIYRQQVAIREIERLGGHVYANQRGPEWLRNRVGADRMRLFDDVHTVDLTGTEATDATLVQVGWLTGLVVVNLDHTRVSDTGLAQLNGLTRLKWLILTDARTTDVGREVLSRVRPGLRIYR